MRLLRTVAEVRRWRRTLGDTAVHLVPTMGALHAGHLSLVRAAEQGSGTVVVSLFVNPTQFAPGEDLGKYPRTFAEDCALLERESVAALFAPEPAEVYPAGFSTAIDVGPVATRLDGASRPGHFAGVATVVAKLFGIVEPQRAFFGQKDAAQVAVLRHLVADLNLPVALEICPTVRESDGLALSSRNRYLSPAERAQALVLIHALRSAEKRATTGVRESAPLLAAAAAVLAAEPRFRRDYLALVDPDTLEEVAALLPGREALLAVAGWVGSTRLIDNLLLRP